MTIKELEDKATALAVYATAAEQYVEVRKMLVSAAHTLGTDPLDLLNGDGPKRVVAKVPSKPKRRAKGMLREEIISAIRDTPKTCAQIAKELGISHQNAAITMNHLIATGTVRDAGPMGPMGGRAYVLENRTSSLIDDIHRAIATYQPITAADVCGMFPDASKNKVTGAMGSLSRTGKIERGKDGWSVR